MANAKASTTEKAFSFETVAVLCCIILKNGTIGGAQYDMMSALDGKRTASAFQHEFRAVLKRAKELKDSMDKEGLPAPVAPLPKVKSAGAGGAKKTSKTSGKKRGEHDWQCLSCRAALTLPIQVLPRSKRRKMQKTLQTLRSRPRRRSRLRLRLELRTKTTSSIEHFRRPRSLHKTLLFLHTYHEDSERPLRPLQRRRSPFLLFHFHKQSDELWQSIKPV